MVYTTLQQQTVYSWVLKFPDSDIQDYSRLNSLYVEIYWTFHIETYSSTTVWNSVTTNYGATRDIDLIVCSGFIQPSLIDW